MTLVAPEPTRRGAILSRARATALAEDIAAKHDLSVQTILTARWDRYAMAAKAELAHTLNKPIEHGGLNWSLRQVGEFLGCSHENVRQHLTCHQMNARRARRWLPSVDFRALANIEADEAKRRALEAEERASYLQAELERLTGKHLVERIGEELGLERRLRCAIVLAIVCEAYPRVVSGPDIIELYDEACVRLVYGLQEGADYRLISTNVKDLRRHFQTNGWANPIVQSTVTPGGQAGARQLTPEAAAFMHARLGSPKLSQIEAAREQRPRGR